MLNEPDQTQTGKTVRGKYECVVVKFDEVYIVACPGDVMNFGGEKISFHSSKMFRILATKPSFEGDPEPKPILPRYNGYPYIRVGGDDFSDINPFQNSVREEIKSLEGKLSEGEQLSLTRIRQHLAQKPEYVVFGNYKPFLS